MHKVSNGSIYLRKNRRSLKMKKQFKEEIMRTMTISCLLLALPCLLMAQTLVATYPGSLPGSLTFYNGQIAYKEDVEVPGEYPVFSALHIRDFNDVTLFTWTPPAGRYYYLEVPADAYPIYAGSGYYYRTIPTSGFTSGYDANFHLADENGVEYFLLEHADLSRIFLNYDTQTYYFGLFIFDNAGGVIATEIYQGGSFPTGVKSEPIIVKSLFTLEGNYPNPFNAGTTIKYTLHEPAAVDIVIHDLNGRVIDSESAGLLPSGTHTFFWDGKNRSGINVSSGVYFVSVLSNDISLTKKLMLIK